MEWCIDANIAVKAVVKERLSEKARILITDASDAEVLLIAPLPDTKALVRLAPFVASHSLPKVGGNA